jgi:outer membrane protein TolC
MQKITSFYSLITFISLASITNLNALTLEEVINQAMLSSPAIQKSKSIATEAEWKRKENLSVFLPSVSASATHLLSKKLALTNVRLGNAQTDTIVPQIIPSSQLVLNTSFPLFEGFASINRYQSAIENDSAANFELSWTKFKLEMDVTLAFYKTLASQTLKEVAEKNLQVLQDHLKEVKLFKKSGMVTNYDVLRVEVQVSNAETDLLNAIDNIASNEQNLLEFLGGEKSLIEINGKLPNLDASLVTQISSSDIQTRTDIKALKNRTMAFTYADKAQQSFFIPRLALMGQYQYYNNLTDSLTETNKYRSAYQVGLQLTWNIFDGLISFSRSKQTTEQIVQSEKNYRMIELKAQKDFEVGKRKYNYFLNLTNARKNDIAKSAESVRLAKEGIRVGARTNSDLLDAESDMYKSEAGAVNAQLGAIEALINLQISVGKKIIY